MLALVETICHTTLFKLSTAYWSRVTNNVASGFKLLLSSKLMASAMQSNAGMKINSQYTQLAKVTASYTSPMRFLWEVFNVSLSIFRNALVDLKLTKYKG